MPKFKKQFRYAVVGINLKNEKVFLHLTTAADKGAARADFFATYEFGQYGLLATVELPKLKKV